MKKKLLRVAMLTAGSTGLLGTAKSDEVDRKPRRGSIAVVPDAVHSPNHCEPVR